MSKVEVIVNNCRGSQEQVRTYGPELIRKAQVLEHEERKVESALAL